MIEVKSEFTNRELVWFGPLFSVFGGIIGYLFVSKLHLPMVAYGIWGACAVIIAIYYSRPAWQPSIFKGWLYSVAPIGFVISHVLLAIAYYLVVTPIGIMMRIAGYDPMKRKFDPSARSYWIERDKTFEPDSYFRQY